MFRKILLSAVIAVLVTAPLITEFGTVSASSHREAPLISQDPLADNTDLYAFVSPDKPDTVTIIANYIPLEEPSSGPNFYNLDASLFKTFQFKERFKLEVRAEAFAVPNSPSWQLNNPNTSVNDSANFGYIRGAGGNRGMQFGLKLQF